MLEQPLWYPTDDPDCVLKQYTKFLADRGLKFDDYRGLHEWSIQNRDAFWQSLFTFSDLIHEGSIFPAFNQDTFIPYTWFPNVRLNFAENLLRHQQGVALHAVHESGTQRQLTYGQLRGQVAALQRRLAPHVTVGDVVAAYMPNIPETVVAMLATAGLGGIFTSTSCDFGVSGVVERFGQSLPKVLVAVPRYSYKGKEIDLRENIRLIQEAIPSIQLVVTVDFLAGEIWEESQDPPTFKRLPFCQPLYIMYSSGTTGKPKCIIHTAGGTLLQHAKELGIHSDVRIGQTVLFFTTCGWMMWNWMVSGLLFGARLVLYEGAPAFQSLMECLQSLNVVHWGTSPKYLKGLESSGYNRDHSLENLRSVWSTGAPLLPEQYDFVYERIKSRVHLVSLSGGTDILGCFLLGNPQLPVWRGELQCAGLGMDVVAMNDVGTPVIDEQGELVCRAPFPSTPYGFLNDPGDRKFKEAYFERFPDMWHHGDFIRIRPNGTVRIFGRSDATLNPGGVRIGTAEIYRVVEQLPWVEDSLCVAQGDSIVLYVKPMDTEVLTAEREQEIRQRIRLQLSARHVPETIKSVRGIPYTRSGKKMELLVSRLVNGQEIVNLEAVANPGCLKEYTTGRSGNEKDSRVPKDPRDLNDTTTQGTIRQL